MVIFITLVAALIASFSQLYYKKGLKMKINNLADGIDALKNRNIQLGVLGYIVSLVIYLYALSNAQLSVVYPIFASTFIFVAVLSAVLLKESLSRTRILGVLLVFLGVVIIAFSIGV